MFCSDDVFLTRDTIETLDTKHLTLQNLLPLIIRLMLESLFQGYLTDSGVVALERVQLVMTGRVVFIFHY